MVMASRQKELREKFKEQLNSILEEGYKKRKKYDTLEDRQRILKWEMSRIRHAYDSYRREIDVVAEGRRISPEKRRVGKAKAPKREPGFADKRPSQKAKRPKVQK